VAAPAASTRKRHLGRGVEAETEQQADRIHVPGPGHSLGHTAQNPVHEAASLELFLEFPFVIEPVAHVAEDPQDANEDHGIDEADDEQEDPRDRRADHAGRLLECR